MQKLIVFLALGLVLPSFAVVVDDDDLRDSHHPHKRHHKDFRHHRHGARHVVDKPHPAPKAVAKAPVVAMAAQASHHADSDIVDKMKRIEARLAEKTKEKAAEAKAMSAAYTKGHLLVNGPLPVDFSERFSQAVGHATGVDPRQVKVTETVPVEDQEGIVEVGFVAPPKVVKAVEDEAADPESKFAKGNMRPFLVAKDEDQAPSGKTSFTVHKAQSSEAPAEHKPELKHHAAEPSQEVTPVEEKGIDIDTQMPYGDLEPFGREDTAQELTESSVRESDEMVDQLERAEVAEEKRAVFRALTRLRGAAITSFDGVARSQTGNIDEYNKVHKWRKTHPLHHLANEESDVTKWAFPDNADF